MGLVNKKGRQMIICSNKSHVNAKKQKQKRQEVNVHFSTFGAKKDPEKTGGKSEHCTGSRTSLSTLEKKLRRLQPQGVNFPGPMLANVSATGTYVLT